MSALVIKEWKSGNKPLDEAGNLVCIKGRASGFLAWVLSLLKVDPTTKIAVSRDRVEFSTASLSGTELRLIPLQGVCSTYYGYHKPWKSAVSIFTTFCLLGMGMASAMAGDHAANLGAGFMGFAMSAIVGLGFALIYYAFNQTLTMGFIENSGVANGIQFKRGVIESVDVNEAQAKAVCLFIQQLIEEKERRARQGSLAA